MMQHDFPEFAEGDLSYYLAALDGKPPALESDAQIEQGYYRVRRKGQDWEPVMFMIENDYWIGVRNDVPVPSDRLAELFRWACRNPVSRDAYNDAVEGKGWADEPPSPIGHNLPPEADPYDRISFELSAELELIKEMLKKPVENQDEADRIGIWVNKVRDFMKAAEAQETIELAPVKEAETRIKLRWGGLLDQAEGLLKRMKDHVRPWFAKLEQLELERQETARRNAEALHAKAAEMLKAAGGNADRMADAGAVIASAQAAEREMARRNPQAGRTGAKMAMRTRYTAFIENYDLAFQAVKEEDEVKKLVQRIANACARVKGARLLPGTVRVEVKEPV